MSDRDAQKVETGKGKRGFKPHVSIARRNESVSEDWSFQRIRVPRRGETSAKDAQEMEKMESADTSKKDENSMQVDELVSQIVSMFVANC